MLCFKQRRSTTDTPIRRWSYRGRDKCSSSQVSELRWQTSTTRCSATSTCLRPKLASRWSVARVLFTVNDHPRASTLDDPDGHACRAFLNINAAPENIAYRYVRKADGLSVRTLL